MARMHKGSDFHFAWTALVFLGVVAPMPLAAQQPTGNQAELPPAASAGLQARCKPIKGSTQLTVRKSPPRHLQEAEKHVKELSCSAAEFNLKGEDVSLAGWTPNCNYGQYLLLCHDPLYFEDISLERYGEQDCYFIQPFASATKFFATVPCAPYKWAVNRQGAKHGEHFACDHHGQLRPGAAEGACLPFRVVPAAFTVGLVTGLMFALP